jgi:hypothetical protein
MPITKGDGCYPKLLTPLTKSALLLLDGWGLVALSDENRRDLLEFLADRQDCRATSVTSPRPVEQSCRTGPRFFWRQGQ